MNQGPNPETVKQVSEANAEADQHADAGERRPSSAPNTSLETGAGDGTVGFDSPADESRWLSNTDVDDSAIPYYPPDGPRDGPSSKPDDTDAA